jgi:nicotinamidase-related amidase
MDMSKEKYFFDFIQDKNGPHKIARKSYLEIEKLALLVIDMQNYMIDHLYTGKWSSRGSGDYYYNRAEKTVIPNIIKLINFFRKKHSKIIYTRITSSNKNFADVPSTAKKNLVDEDNIDINGNRWTLYVEDNASLIEQRLKPSSDDIVIFKGGSGAFCSSEMDLILRSNNISRLIFTGGLTDACVSSSLRQAWDRGYLCTVAEDACIASCKEDHDAEIRILGKYYAWVTNTDEILKYLNF